MKKILAILLAFCMTMCLMCGCGSEKPAEAPAPGTSEPQQSSAPAEKETSEEAETAPAGQVEVLTLAGGSDCGAPQPFTHSVQGSGWIRTDMIFDTLLERGTESYIPWTAEEWSLADDGVTYSFKLRDNAVWHDGEPLTAEDVGFTIDYLKQYPDVKVTLGQGDDFKIASYEIVDEHNINIVAVKPDYANISAISSMRILPKHIWEKVDDPYNFTEPEAFIGSGMFKFESYDGATGTYTYEAFEDYGGPMIAGAKKLRYVPVSDPVLAFENGDIDITSLPADLYDSYAARDDIKIFNMNDFVGFKLIINYNNVPELLDLNVRQALYRALDREKMVESVYRGQGHVASAGHVPQTTPFYEPSVKTYDYDPEGAKEVLEPLGLSFSLAITNDTSGVNAAMAELIKMDLAAAGVEVNVEAYDTMVRNEMCAKGEYDVALAYHGGWSNEPDFVLRAYSSTFAKNPTAASLMCSTGYENEELTEAVQAAMSLLNFDERVEAFKKVQIMGSENIPVIPLITQVTNYMYRADGYSGWKASFFSTNPMVNRISFAVER